MTTTAPTHPYQAGQWVAEIEKRNALGVTAEVARVYCVDARAAGKQDDALFWAGYTAWLVDNS